VCGEIRDQHHYKVRSLPFRLSDRRRGKGLPIGGLPGQAAGAKVRHLCSLRSGLRTDGHGGVGAQDQRLQPLPRGMSYRLRARGLTNLEYYTRCSWSRAEKDQPILHSRHDRQHGSRADRHRIRVKGPNLSIETACAASSHAIGESFRLIREGRADAMITGGAEAVVTRLPWGVLRHAKPSVLATRSLRRHPGLLTSTVTAS